MKKIVILLLLLAAQALGAQYVNINAVWTIDGVPTVDVDSIAVYAARWAATPLHAVTTDPDSSVWQTVLEVDSVGEYSLTYLWYYGGVQVMRDTDTKTSWAASLADSVYSAIADANKGNFKATDVNVASISSGVIDSADFANDAKKMIAIRSDSSGTAAAAKVWAGTAIGDKTVTVNAIAANAITATAIASNAITAAKLADDADIEIGYAVWTATGGDSVLQALDYTYNARPVLRSSAAAVFLDVSGTGGAGIDWSNVESKTATVNLSATTIGTANTVGATGVAAMADGVWDEDTAGHIHDQTNMGYYASRTAAATFPPANEIADSVWSETYKAIANKKVTVDNISAIANASGDSVWSTTVTAVVDREVTASGVSLDPDDITDIAAATAAAVGTGLLWPIQQGAIEIDSGGGANARKIFVTDTAAIGAVCGGVEEILALPNQQIIVRQGDHKPVAVGISAVSYSGGNVWVTVTDSLPQAFADADSVWFIGNIAYDYVTATEAADTNAAHLLATDTSGYGGAANIGGSIVTGGTAALDSTETADLVRDALNDSVGTRVGLDSIPRLANLVDSAKLATFKIKTVDSTGVLGQAVTVGSVDITSIDGSQAAATALANAFVTASPLTPMYILADSVRGVGSTSGGSCTGSGSNSVTMYARDTLNNARVSGVTITMTSGVNRYWAATNSSGKALFSLDSATWTATANDGLRSYVPRSIIVNTAALSTTPGVDSGTVIDSVNGGGITVATPTDPTLCRVYGYLKDAGKQAIVGAIVSLTLVDCADTLNYGNAEYACNTELTARTNSVGYWYIDVVPNATLDANSKYEYGYYKKGTLNVERKKKITVPVASSVDITTLLGD